MFCALFSYLLRTYEVRGKVIFLVVSVLRFTVKGRSYPMVQWDRPPDPVRISPGRSQPFLASDPSTPWRRRNRDRGGWRGWNTSNWKTFLLWRDILKELPFSLQREIYVCFNFKILSFCHFSWKMTDIHYFLTGKAYTSKGETQKVK